MATLLNYPSSLPNPEITSLEEAATDVWTADVAEVGTARRRARFTRSLLRWSWTQILTATEKATLDTFYDTTLEKGVLTFNWIHPITSVSYEVLFNERPANRHFIGTHYSSSVGISQI